MPDGTHAPAAGSFTGTRLADVEGLRGGKRRWLFGNEAAFAAPRRIWGIPAAFQGFPPPGLSPGGRGEPRIVARRVSVRVPDTAARPRCRTPRARPLSGAGWRQYAGSGRGGD